MKHASKLYAIITLAMLSFVMTNAQTGGNASKHYEKDGLIFDYPDDWVPTESSSQGVQTVTLARKGSVAQIVVSVQDGLMACDFEAERKKIADVLTERLESQIYAEAAHRSLPVTTRIGGSDVEGVQLQGVVKRKPVTGAVYSFRLNRRFVSLINILPADDKRAKSAWNTVRSSLTVAPGVQTVLGTQVADSSKPSITSGVLNGRALALPKPDYPRAARSARAAGTVRVQVSIDETGNVISAHAVDGNPLLHAVSVAAAKQARFSPTQLCGEPVRVTGVITYNFVAL